VSRHMHDVVVGHKPIFCTCISQSVSFWVLTAVILRFKVFWNVMLCRQASSPDVPKEHGAFKMIHATPPLT
jgi:hypothetical protein